MKYQLENLHIFSAIKKLQVLVNMAEFSLEEKMNMKHMQLSKRYVLLRVINFFVRNSLY